MAEDHTRQRPSLPFDRMLDEGHKGLDALYGEVLPDGAGMPPHPAGHRSHTVITRLREGDDAVVRCRVAVEGSGAGITRHGRARIARPRDTVELAGSAAGVPFTVRVDTRPGPEDAALAEAYGRAEAAALDACIAAL